MTPTEQESEQETVEEPGWASQMWVMIDQHIDKRIEELRKRITELEARIAQE